MACPMLQFWKPELLAPFFPLSQLLLLPSLATYCWVYTWQFFPPCMQEEPEQFLAHSTVTICSLWLLDFVCSIFLPQESMPEKLVLCTGPLDLSLHITFLYDAFFHPSVLSQDRVDHLLRTSLTPYISSVITILTVLLLSVFLRRL